MPNAYVGNNPLAFVDPTGLSEQPASCKPEKGCFHVQTTEHLSIWQRIWNWLFGSGGAAATIRPGNSAQYRAAWEREHPGQKFPKNEAGRNLDADHNTPISEGGDPLDGKNITPRECADNIARHKAEGHYKKWGQQGARARAGNAARPAPEPPPEMPDLPLAPKPFVPGLDPDPLVALPLGEDPVVPEIPEIPEIQS